MREAEEVRAPVSARTATAYRFSLNCAGLTRGWCFEVTIDVLAGCWGTRKGLP